MSLQKLRDAMAATKDTNVNVRGTDLLAAVKELPQDHGMVKDFTTLAAKAGESMMSLHRTHHAERLLALAAPPAPEAGPETLPFPTRADQAAA
jgi:hypothetical protein